MDEEMKTALFAVAIFAAGGVALILYQHATHTSAILAAAGAATGSGAGAATSAPNASPVASGPASLGGTPTPGGLNYAPEFSAEIVPINIGANWQIN